jgi:hypothetical protein
MIDWYFYLYILTFLLLLFCWLEWIFVLLEQGLMTKSIHTDNALFVPKTDDGIQAKDMCSRWWWGLVNDNLLLHQRMGNNRWAVMEQQQRQSSDSQQQQQQAPPLVIIVVPPFFTVIFLLYIEIHQHITPSGDDMIYSLPLLFELIS